MDRFRLAALYPESAFAEDRNRNARTEAAVRHGLNLGPETAARAARHVGEVAGPPESAFVAPFPEESYDAFLERALEELRRLPEPVVDPKVLHGARQ
jgi:hypothetical protein